MARLRTATGLLALLLTQPLRGDDAFIELDDVVHHDHRLVLRANAITPACPPKSWRWQVADEQDVREATTPTNALFHEFASSGNYRVIVEITDACGNAYTGTRSLRVQRQTANHITLTPYADAGPFTYSLTCDPAGHGSPGMNLVWHVTRDDTPQPVLDLTPHGEPPRERLISLPGPGTYHVTCTAINRNDRFRTDYWTSDAFVPCNSASGCYTTVGTALLMIAASAEQCTDTDGGRNHLVVGTASVGSAAFTDHTDAHGRHVEYYCNTNGHLISETREPATFTRETRRSLRPLLPRSRY